MIRRINSADAASIRQLLASSPQAAQWSLQDVSESFFPNDSSLNSCSLVAEEAGEVIGMIAVRVMADEGEILNLAIAVPWRRRGVGSRLVESAIAQARAAGTVRVFLEVRESNAVARAFYSRMRFIEVGRRRGYYRDPDEDALVLTRVT
jgi:ribosomal-protein-alanine acetyltransferase